MYRTLSDNWLYGNYRSRTFTDIFPTFEAFQTDYQESKLNNKFSLWYKDECIEALYYLLYARYGNSHIAASDENQFKYRLWAIIMQYGPTWKKDLEMQLEIRELSQDELRESAQAIYNHAYNPSTDPTTQTLEELTTVNEQNVTKHKRSKTDAYAVLNMLLREDVTEKFIRRFQSLFLKVVAPENPLWYATPLKEDEDD